MFERGFTLIELVIVMLVVSILASIAYPYYTAFVFQSRLSDAQASLEQYQTILERCYAQQFAYSGCASLSSLSP